MGSRRRREKRREKRRKKLSLMNGVEAKEGKHMSNMSDEQTYNGKIRYVISSNSRLEATAEQDLETFSRIAGITISEKSRDHVKPLDEDPPLKDNSITIPDVEKKVSLTKHADMDSSKSFILPDFTSNAEVARNNISNRCKKAKRKGKKRFYGFSEYNMELGEDDPSSVTSSLLGIVDLELAGKKKFDASIQNKVMMSIGVEANGLSKSLDDDPPNRSGIGPQMSTNLYKVKYPSSTQSKVRRQENNKSLDYSTYNIEELLRDLPDTKPQVLDCGAADCSDKKKELISALVSHAVEDVPSLDKAVPVLLRRRLTESTRTNLLVLDLNGLLADIRKTPNVQKEHRNVGGKSVFRRPFCNSFLNFCFDRFAVGVWSSRKRSNVDKVVDYLMKDFKDRLLFCWDLSKCTSTRFRTLENKHKPLVLKELKKLWNKEEPNLPWEMGEFYPTNTLLVDDSPYKALLNPPHTAIFPPSYHFNNGNDNSLGPGGDLRKFLEGAAIAHDVQHYVQHHPFGQPAITEKSPSWNFYLDVINTFEKFPAPA